MSATRTRRSLVDERRATVEAALEDELRRIVDSGEYARWFQAVSRFHRYSPTNTLWILAQRPDATRVASYRTWQQVGRQVRRGETGIMVFHPKPYWVDPATGERVAPPATEAERRSLQRQCRSAWATCSTWLRPTGNHCRSSTGPLPTRRPANSPTTSPATAATTA